MNEGRHMKYYTLSKGFSLIELMIVVAIVGILAAVAVPSYRDYVIRSKIAEAFAVLEPMKTEAVEQYLTTGTMPTNGGGDFDDPDLWNILQTNNVYSTSFYSPANSTVYLHAALTNNVYTDSESKFVLF